jgi:heme exporter protein A
MSALTCPERLTAAADEPAAAAAAPARCEAVDVRLGDRPILRQISLAVKPRTILALLGANGAGKSTLISALATLVPISGGGLYLFGQRVGRNAAALRARIGMIGHQPMLYRDLTARENLRFFGDLYGVASRDARADELLDRVRLLDRADDPVKTFSRGMTQRLAIARALMHGPELLLADEPFSGLDVPSSDALDALLRGLRDEGKAIVLAHHDLEHALRCADEVAVLRRGRLVLHRPVNEVTPRQVRAEVMA